MECRFMAISNRFFAQAIATLTLLTATSLQAGEITGFSWFSGVASVAATTILPPVAPNNDNVAGASLNNAWITQKDYRAIGPVDLLFPVTATGGVTEYSFDEGVYNGTGLNWTGYHIELGFGIGTGFVKSLAGDGLDFDAPDFDSPLSFNPSPGFFPLVSASEDDILAGGGNMPAFSFAGNFRFSVDVPDGITSFTIRQSPVNIVPEPSTWVLAAMSLVGLAVYHRQRMR
jgi:hypothetical protein